MSKKELLHRICRFLDKVNKKYDNLNPTVREVASVAIIVLITTSNNLVGACIGTIFIALRAIHFKGYWDKWSDKFMQCTCDNEDEKVQEDINC